MKFNYLEKHPRKTRKDVLLEKYPNALMHSDGICPQACAKLLGLCSYDECKCNEDCLHCWNTEVEE